MCFNNQENKKGCLLDDMDHSFLIHNNMIIQFSSFHLLPSLSLFQIFSFSGGLRILFVKLVFAIFKSMKKKASIVSELDSREQRHQWQNHFFFFCDKVTIPLFGFARERQVNGPGAVLPTVLNPLETKKTCYGRIAPLALTCWEVTSEYMMHEF